VQSVDELGQHVDQQSQSVVEDEVHDEVESWQRSRRGQHSVVEDEGQVVSSVG